MCWVQKSLRECLNTFSKTNIISDIISKVNSVLRTSSGAKALSSFPGHAQVLNISWVEGPGMWEYIKGGGSIFWVVRPKNIRKEMGRLRAAKFFFYFNDIYAYDIIKIGREIEAQ